MSHTFAIMWDCDGLEAISDVTAVEQERAWQMLQGFRNPPYKLPNIETWRMRAQANPQRNYEIYVLQAEPGITEEDIRSAFEASPQTIVDTIRKIGHAYYSNRLAGWDRVIV